jgi:hypothetical protein
VSPYTFADTSNIGRKLAGFSEFLVDKVFLIKKLTAVR